MPGCADIVLLAEYNAGMNRKLYDAAARPAPEALRADRKAFFGSLLGTMNHLVAADTIRLARFTLHPTAFRALDPLRGVAIPGNLTQSYGDEAELREDDLAQALVYRNTRGQGFRKPFGSLLLHFFNHQTHHRGQASTLLTQAGVDIGVTDLLVSIPDAD